MTDGPYFKPFYWTRTWTHGRSGLGIIGMLAALIGKSKWGRKPFLLAIYGILSGFLYSMMMDIYTYLHSGKL
jgi:disulfide bond formation protein DsbB